MYIVYCLLNIQAGTSENDYLVVYFEGLTSKLPFYLGRGNFHQFFGGYWCYCWGHGFEEELVVDLASQGHPEGEDVGSEERF